MIDIASHPPTIGIKDALGKRLHTPQCSSMLYVRMQTAPIKLRALKSRTTDYTNRSSIVDQGLAKIFEIVAISGMLDPSTNHRFLSNRSISILKDLEGRELKYRGSSHHLRNIPRALSLRTCPSYTLIFMQQDPRVNYSDVRARQPHWMSRQSANEINAFNSRRTRAGRSMKCLLKLLEKLMSEQIRWNTTWSITPKGVHPPNNPDWLFLKEAFIMEGHKMRVETQRGMKELKECRAKAVAAHLNHWSQLPKSELPSICGCVS